MPLTTDRQTTKENAKKAKEMKRELVTTEIACKVGEKHFYILEHIQLLLNVFITTMLGSFNYEIIIN